MIKKDFKKFSPRKDIEKELTKRYEKDKKATILTLLGHYYLILSILLSDKI